MFISGGFLSPESLGFLSIVCVVSLSLLSALFIAFGVFYGFFGCGSVVAGRVGCDDGLVRCPIIRGL